MKPVLLIKETARQNVRDLEREVILKGALEPEQPRESWDTQKMCGCVKWKLKVSGTMIWRSRKDCSTVQTQVCDMRPSRCVECGSKAGHSVKSLEVLKYSCQKEKKKVIYCGRAEGDSKGKTIQSCSGLRGYFYY